MKFESKYSADNYWEKILLQDYPTGCVPPVISYPFSESLASGHTTGCLLGNATQETNDVLLTPSATSTYGAVVYNEGAFQAYLNINFTYEVSNPSSGNGADAVFVYFNSSEDPLTEDANISGYLIGFSEYHQLLTIKYNTDIINSNFEIPGTPITVNDNTPYNVSIQFGAGAFNVYINSMLIVTVADANYNSRSQDATHVKLGLGGRCGAFSAEHRVSNLAISIPN